MSRAETRAATTTGVRTPKAGVQRDAEAVAPDGSRLTTRSLKAVSGASIEAREVHALAQRREECESHFATGTKDTKLSNLPAGLPPA